jgi:hypothetical protein
MVRSRLLDNGIGLRPPALRINRSSSINTRHAVPGTLSASPLSCGMRAKVSVSRFRRCGGVVKSSRS